MLRSDYLSENIIETIYFGGGTPSTLSYLQINQVIELIQRRFEISNSAEITLEANPDDLSEKYVSDLTKTAVNRISLGIQSFDDADLVLMNRRHSATEAIDAVRRLQSAGFTNISGDLIYGLPGMTGEKWQKNLDTFFSLNIPHFSAYHLTYEKDTIFYNKLKSGLLKETKEAKSEEFFTLLIENAKLNDFEHYEISNFAKSGYHSRHNSAYWSDNEYLGLGPSGHSFNGKTRDWNPADIDLYIRSYREQKIITETEKISKKDLYNEFVMKRLRTSAGVKKSDLSLRFPLKYK